ncbi:hypothetical protein [Nocardioides sp.]|uniref:hypothetical protein n=1 Tax=Nocardioides sp. TaxID=35761 RepID=UPI0027175B43|nr:hypothetical protein [Nocardioides sp.]MDO9456945.1 hypothetical protein [Nocardioides sp.]
MLDLPDDWVWDFWTCREGERTHLFFLHAPRSLGDPDRRHEHAAVGHAVSTDLVTWTRLTDALAPQPPPAFDDLACWTGSVARADDGRWWMFTSGITRATGPAVQRIGSSWSDDLVTWTRTDLVLEADPRFYRLDDEVHWRDPCVVRGDDGLWHMLVTAKTGVGRGGGVVGHATSSDLVSWDVGPPLSAATGRFDQLEVVRVVEVDGRGALLFSCLGTEMPGAAPGDGGVWSVPLEGPGRPVDVASAVRLVGEELYVGDVVPGPDGPALLAFRHTGADGRFVGGVTDPVRVGWRPDDRGLQTFT